MVIKWLDTQGPAPPVDPPKLRAAEYVRMSTEHQKYSTDNQSSAIRKYAEQRGYEIVRTYADEGKSGLNIGGRLGLQKLLADVEAGDADFEALLVYDVSRWGRFQDPDEAASYELRCRRAGVQVHYCAEQFENDGSIGSSIIKTVKRAMAGEYSRELSVKVFAGQTNLIRLGYRQGGPAGFGLRRMLVDQEGREKGLLDHGQHKSITTDRVILVPGPAEEVDIVREVYRLFVEHGRSEREIAEELNERGVTTDLGRPWTRGSVHQLLINEKYIGNNVWARTSCKLKGSHVRNDPEEWIRADGAFAGIVDARLFEAAQSIIRQRSARLSDEDMLGALSQILARNGCLSGLIIDETDDCPSSSSFRTRFGSLLRAYTLVGFTPDHDYRYLETNRKLRTMYPGIMEAVMAGIERVGGSVSRDPVTDSAVVWERRVTNWQTSDAPKLSEPSDDLLVQIVDDLGITDLEKRKLAKHQLSAHANSFALGRYVQGVYPTVHQDAATFREISDALKVVADKLQALNPMMSVAIAEAWRQQRLDDDGSRSLGDLQADLGKLQILAEQVGHAKFSNKQRDEVLRNSIGGLMLLLEKLTGKRATVRKRDSDLDLPPELNSAEARTIGRLLRVTEPDLEDTTIVNVITAIRRNAGNGPLNEFEHQLFLGGQVTHF